MQQIHHYINGQRCPGRSGRTAPVFDPATGTQTSEVLLASTDEVGVAVKAAHDAFDSWRRSSLSERTKLMFNFRNLLELNASEIASRITAEHGKISSDALGEVARGIENVEYACGITEHLKGSYSEQVSKGVDVTTVRQPVGVIAGITPFNFPAMVPLWMIPNAVACGNTFVLKPSEKDPSATLLIAELFQEAGFPNGVLNVLNGDRVAVEGLLEHPQVSAVSFVGSTPIARSIHQRASAKGKRVQALGGAKNHMLVMPDADFAAAADAAVSAAFGSAGERCMAISVVVAIGDAADPLVEAIRQRSCGLRVGPGSESASEMGPLITREHRDRVSDYIGEGIAAGATAVIDGRESQLHQHGFFLGATLLDHVTEEMSVYQDEVFGPLLSVVRVASYAEAMQLLTANPYGNGAAIFTSNGGTARRFQQDAEVGMLGINVPIPVPVGNHSFGGWKDSLFGDAHMYGPEGVRFYTRAKAITSRWHAATDGDRGVDLAFPSTS